jgi:cytochrome P450
MITKNLSLKSYPTVLQSIHDSPTLPPHERSFDRLANEALALLAAGSETTGSTLSSLTYHVLANPAIHARLKRDLRAAAEKNNIPRTELLDSTIVESLPYLQALLKESLRWTTPITGRLPRRHPTLPLIYTSPSGPSYTLPPNTTLSMTIRDCHFSPSIFPSPHTFDPERWITSSAEELARMNRAFMPFGKGPRVCVGMELAKKEVLLVAGNVFWRYELELEGTGVESVAFEHDLFGAWEREGGGGVRVRVREG